MNKMLCVIFSLFLILPLKAQDAATYGSGVQGLLRGSGIDCDIRGNTVSTHRTGEPDQSRQDTLPAALVTDWKRMRKNPGTLLSDMPEIRDIISPLGEGDPLRWVQSLPGVAGGADGSTAIYVRGGNLGNNLFSLDGVPVYGYSHLLGLTTVIPLEAVNSVSLSRGGFEGGQANFTASHLNIRTNTPGANGRRSSLSVNNFLVSAFTEGGVGERLTYSVSARISPLSLEYRAFRGLLPDLLSGFDGFNAGVGDLYSQVHWRIAPNRHLSGFVLGSLDQYRFSLADGTGDTMGWNNLIASMGYNEEQDGVDTEIRAYVNRYGSIQLEDKVYHEERQTLSLKSELTEFSLAASQTRQAMERIRYSYGLNLREALFNPGQVGSVSHFSNSLLSTAWVQGNYDIPDKLSMMLSIRGNIFTRFKKGQTFLIPDAGMSIKWSPVKMVILNMTIDKSSQFYHTLEGLPTGWSLDIIVPSGKMVRPETALQAYLGLDLLFDRHNLSVGVFHKWMDGLVYFKYAPALFSGALAAWEDYADVGKGYSYGAEFTYEYAGKDLHAQIAYTLSKTNRMGFESIMDGAPFHARFDRRHVMNASASWRRFQLSFTFQSGHWENSMAQKAEMHFLDETWMADYFVEGGVNDYHMPDVIRLDLAYRFSFESRRCHHELNLGVCNVTNHFNPFMLYFDAKTESWKEIALLPILPNFSWRVTF